MYITIHAAGKHLTGSTQLPVPGRYSLPSGAEPISHGTCIPLPSTPTPVTSTEPPSPPLRSSASSATPAFAVASNHHPFNNLRSTKIIFFKNSPKLACQAPKQPKTNILKEILLA
jgi:hypothetical protein